jgi:membrane-anchored protein YejM (alkaline phosphatase superfamily)
VIACLGQFNRAPAAKAFLEPFFVGNFLEKLVVLCNLAFMRGNNWYKAGFASVASAVGAIVLRKDHDLASGASMCAATIALRVPSIL